MTIGPVMAVEGQGKWTWFSVIRVKTGLTGEWANKDDNKTEYWTIVEQILSFQNILSYFLLFYNYPGSVLESNKSQKTGTAKSVQVKAPLTITDHLFPVTSPPPSRTRYEKATVRLLFEERFGGMARHGLTKNTSHCLYICFVKRLWYPLCYEWNIRGTGGPLYSYVVYMDLVKCHRTVLFCVPLGVVGFDSQELFSLWWALHALF